MESIILGPDGKPLQRPVPEPENVLEFFAWEQIGMSLVMVEYIARNNASEPSSTPSSSEGSMEFKATEKLVPMVYIEGIGYVNQQIAKDLWEWGQREPVKQSSIPSSSGGSSTPPSPTASVPSAPEE